MLTVVLLVLVSVVVLPGRTFAAPPPHPASRYTMTAFTNASETDMYVYESNDGTGFRSIHDRAYRPPFGLVRDPSIFRHPDGTYYLTYTTGWDGMTIGFARSPDRVHWTFQRFYPIPFCCVGIPGTGSSTGSAPGTGSAAVGSAAIGSGGTGSALSPVVSHAWAPSWFIDGDRINIVVSLSSGGDFVPYLMTALDPGMTLWSLPVPLNGIGTNHIDTVIVKTGPQYHAFTKNETTKYVEHAIAPTPTGPYSIVAAGNWAGWGKLKEGPSLVQLDDGRWRIFLDAYTEHRYVYSDSADGFRTWSPMRNLPGLSGFVRHFTVLKEPA